MTDKFDLDQDEIKPVRHRGLFDWMQSIVMMLLAVTLLVTFAGTSIAVQGPSMAPTLQEGDQMIVRTIFYTPRRGDVIVFAQQNFQDGAGIVKRVIALAGDVVDLNIETGVVYVNGVALDEPYTSGPTNRAGDIGFPFTVPVGHVFVIGDNRNNSMDSRNREIGPVDEREIIGQAVAVITPFDRMGFV